MNTRTIKRRIEVQRRKSERLSAYLTYRNAQIAKGEDYQSYKAFTFQPKSEPAAEVETSQN